MQVWILLETFSTGEGTFNKSTIFVSVMNVFQGEGKFNKTTVLDSVRVSVVIEPRRMACFVTVLPVCFGRV